MKTKHRGWTIEVKKAHGQYLNGSWWFELTNCTEKIISGAIVYKTAQQALQEGKRRIDKTKKINGRDFEGTLRKMVRHTKTRVRQNIHAST